ncbi:MAG: NADP-dependent malic enzyme [Capsulimonadaceae bacterium]|nr:NADP-dependent malic enzyme [Capsulimonadaceae bacterium]
MASAFDAAALEIHKRLNGKITIQNKAECNSETLPLFYTPGVGAVSTYLAQHPEEAGEYSVVGNCVAVVSDGSAVLGLGNIGPYGALPVMEGKAMIFRSQAGIDSYPIVLNTQDPDLIVEIICAIAPSFGGINIEDISAPRCYEIERRVQDRLSMPVMHDDQHATAIVALCGLINAAKIKGKSVCDFKIAILGAGASASGVARLFAAFGNDNIVLVDSKGIVGKHRTDLDPNKQQLSLVTNHEGLTGGLDEAIKGADVIIGLASAGLVKPHHIKSMAKDPIVFALSNPTPEITPEEAIAAGAAIVGTGRSDYPNQINNALVFPGLFRGALDNRIPKITTDIKLRAAKALADLVENPSPTEIVPSVFNPKVVPAVAASVPTPLA